MPPAISTTSSPAAKITLTALMLSRSNRLTRVKKVSVVSARNRHISAITTISQRSVVPILRMDLAFDPVHRHGARQIFIDQPAVAHMQDAVTVEIDLGDF